MFIIAYTFKEQVHVFSGLSENCKSLILQDKYNIEIFLSPAYPSFLISALDKLLCQLDIYATWLSSIGYLQKQLPIFIFF